MVNILYSVYYTILKPIVVQQRSQPVQNESKKQSTQTNRLTPCNQPVKPLRETYRFWVSRFKNSGTSQPPTAVSEMTTVPEIIETTQAMTNGLGKKYSSIWSARAIIHDDGWPEAKGTCLHPFPYLRKCEISWGLEESYIIRSMPGYRRLVLDRRETWLTAWLVQSFILYAFQSFWLRYSTESDDDRTLCAPTILIPRQWRCYEPDTSKLKAPAPEKRSCELHRQRKVSLKEHASPTPTEWNLSTFWPLIFSFTDRLFNWFPAMYPSTESISPSSSKFHW